MQVFFRGLINIVRLSNGLPEPSRSKLVRLVLFVRPLLILPADYGQMTKKDFIAAWYPVLFAIAHLIHFFFKARSQLSGLPRSESACD